MNSAVLPLDKPLDKPLNKSLELNAAISSVLVWQDDEQNKLFHRIFALFLTLALVFAGMISIIEVPELTRAEKEKIPPQLVKIIERKAIAEPVKPKPAPVIEEPVPEIIPEPELDLVIEPEVEVATSTAERTQQAQAKAKRSGLLAFADELSDMHASAAVDSFSSNDIDAAFGAMESASAAKNSGVGSNALSKLALTTSAETAELAEIGVQKLNSGMSVRKTQLYAAKSVSGKRAINAGQFDKLAALTLNNKGQPANNLPAAVTTESATSQAANKALPAQSDDNPNDRTTESIRQIFDKNKGALYAIYRRALRQDPALQGKVTIDLIIEADGNVSMIALVLSELDFEELESKLLARIKMINFTAQGINPIQLNYTFNFLPF